ncbi:hypothetical protein BD626DRAFT_514985 [Schizophyllum amplum]|uniref:Uncharacterized protein n=1 Tax=Schizophyllum amplum TaxID=97359 RepID=A0A550BY79_9AGAR|nr:hypothetical protein BD626DRAFT_514985 [Auriculariopsis ampla]
MPPLHHPNPASRSGNRAHRAPHRRSPRHHPRTCPRRHPRPPLLYPRHIYPPRNLHPRLCRPPHMYPPQCHRLRLHPSLHRRLHRDLCPLRPRRARTPSHPIHHLPMTRHRDPSPRTLPRSTTRPSLRLPRVRALRIVRVRGLRIMRVRALRLVPVPLLHMMHLLAPRMLSGPSPLTTRVLQSVL